MSQLPDSTPRSAYASATCCQTWAGTAPDLLRDTHDKAWIITTQGIKPEGSFTVVSTLNMGAAVQYRVVGELSPRAGAVAVAPTLEDGYVWLMRDRRAPANAIPV